MKTWRLAIKIVGTAVAVLVVGLAPAGLFVAKAAADRLQLSMMESKSNSMGNMGQPGGQPQSMARGGMQDNKMRMQTPGQNRTVRHRFGRGLDRRQLSLSSIELFPVLLAPSARTRNYGVEPEFRAIDDRG